MNLKELNELSKIPSFRNYIPNKEFLKTKEKLATMQVNVGLMCNLACKHCHLYCGPTKQEIMERETAEACIEVFKKYDFEIMDITGGAPEMMPDFEWFAEESTKHAKNVIVRSNLVILIEEKYKHMPDFYAKNKINLVCSLPSYAQKNTDRQRGKGVFGRSIDALIELNKVGYGKDKDLKLDLVFNPNGAVLPPSHESLERTYKTKLYDDFGIVFNDLFEITNNPIGRFGDFLNRTDNLEGYMRTLYTSFNPDVVENIMCRDMISVSWNGSLYDCDFNLAVDAKVSGKTKSIFDMLENGVEVRNIVTGNHCYACTAGAGSS